MEINMSNIVLATDGSAYADAAARSIVQKRLFRDDVTVHLVHCTPDLSGEVKQFVSRDDITAWHTDESNRAMQSTLDILRAAAIPVETHALIGFAPERIVAVAKEVNAIAIVMGTHGRGAFLDAIIGSVAGRVIAHAPCPVVLVKATASAA
jgi:nucleotide-binding universal stress UspA family protein